MVERCLVSSWILHCCMAMCRLQVAFMEACLAAFPNETTLAAQRFLYRARTGDTLGFTTTPDGGGRGERRCRTQESGVLFLGWGEALPTTSYCTVFACLQRLG